MENIKVFEEWFDSQDIKDYTNKKYMLSAYESGAASRQTEIDELEKQIKAMQKAAQRIMIAIDDDEIEYARRSARKIFKGESNE